MIKLSIVIFHATDIPIFCSAGNDPATDLRGVGMLGLMHILYAVNNDNVSENGAALYCVF